VHADKWWFRFLLGTEAARQLRPSDPFQAELASFGPVPAPRIGVIYGGKGDDEGWDERIPGDDDGTVGVAEAALPEATATKRLRIGHTRLRLEGNDRRGAPVPLRRHLQRLTGARPLDGC
jgi:hypothetical protein